MRVAGEGPSWFLLPAACQSPRRPPPRAQGPPCFLVPRLQGWGSEQGSQGPERPGPQVDGWASPGHVPKRPLEWVWGGKEKEGGETHTHRDRDRERKGRGRDSENEAAESEANQKQEGAVPAETRKGTHVPEGH